ncbi:MAG: DUF4349 domain-containing protein [Candidatus Limnocylindrales bacterium]
MRAKKLCSVLLVAGIFAAACSSTASTPGGYSLNEKALPTYQAYPAASAAGYGVVPEATAAPGKNTGGDQQSAATPAGSAYAAAAVTEDQIVKIGTISIQVAAIDESVLRATDEMHALGGWQAGSDRTVTSAQDLASVTYRLPVNEFETALATMRKLGSKVLSEHTESTAVGGQIVDLQARIANLKASEKAIQAIMTKANTIGDVLTVQQRLAEVQGEIEELSGQLSGLSDQAAYSTLTVVFEVPILATPSPSPSPTPSPQPTATPIPWNAGTEAGQAAGALGEVGKSTATILIWVVILILPIALALVLLLALLGVTARLLDPLRRRLLPFTVGQPATAARPWLAQPATPAQGQPMPGGPAGPAQTPPKA